MGICSNCQNNQIIKTQTNDITPPPLSFPPAKNDHSIFLKGVSISRKSTAITKSITSTQRTSHNPFTFSLLKEINSIRINPKTYSIKLRQCLPSIKKNTLNNKYYLYYDGVNNKKVKLKVTRENFNECIDYLNNFDNQLLQPLEYSPELTISFPNEDIDLANDKEYLFEQLKQLKERISHKYEILDFQYDISPNPMISAIIQIVDSQKVNFQRRNNFLNKNARYVGITYGKINNELFCFYLVFARLK